jgi:hypothetical protein
MKRLKENKTFIRQWVRKGEGEGKFMKRPEGDKVYEND